MAPLAPPGSATEYSIFLFSVRGPVLSFPYLHQVELPVLGEFLMFSEMDDKIEMFSSDNVKLIHSEGVRKY